MIISPLVSNPRIFDARFANDGAIGVGISTPPTS